MQNQMDVLIDLVKDRDNNKSEVVKSDQQIRTHVTRVSFSHQWPEYQIEYSKMIALNVRFEFNCKTLLYHP